MADVSLAVQVRPDDERGKGAARRLRVAGLIPGVVYGGGRETVAITLNAVDLDKLIRESEAGVNTLIDLTGASQVDGRTVLVKDLQRDPVLGRLLHADMYEIDLDAQIRVAVPIHLKGIAVGVTMGGLIDHALRVVELDCLPSAIPDEIIVDVEALEQGQSVHVSDLILPEGVELHTQGDIPVVSVVAPKIEEEPTLEEAEDAEAIAGAEGAEGAPAPAEGDAETARGDRSDS